MKNILSFGRTKKHRQTNQKPLGSRFIDGSTALPIYGFEATRGQSGGIQKKPIAYWPHVDIF